MISLVIPMAGGGTRFAATGESNPKPLIEVVPGKRMVEYVINFLTLSEPHRFVFICLEDHARTFDFERFLRAKTNHCELVIVESVTRGPAATALLAEDFVDPDSELLISYCDSFLTIDPARFLEFNREHRADGGVITYPSEATTDSYAVVDAHGRVRRTAEKEVISPTATAGFYYFAKGRDYFAAARNVIAQDANARREHFVCPVYNELIQCGKTVLAFPISRDQRIEMGTPEDLAAARRRLGGCEDQLAANALAPLSLQ